MRFKNIITLVIVLFFSTSITSAVSNQKKGYNIEVNAPFEEGSVAYLAGYWEDKTYIIDSMIVPQGGLFSFINTERELLAGQYLLYIKPDIQIDLLLDKGSMDLKIKIDKEDLSNSEIQGSEDTELFWEYLKQYNILYAEVNKYATILNAEESSEIGRKKISKEYEKALDNIKQFVKTSADLNKGSWFASFIQSSEQIREPYSVPNTKEEAIENHNYLRDHYFDNMDLADIRLWHTNILVPRVKYYLENVISQHPDTIAKQSSWIVSQTTESPVAFEKMLSYLVNDATTSQAMGMENVWAKLAEDYIFDKNLKWIDGATYNKLKSEYSLIELNRLGMKAQNLRLSTLEGNNINTDEIEAELTILYFYSPTCSFCRDEIPKLKKDIYDMRKDKGMQVIAVNLDRDMDMWKDFVVKNEMEEWINAFDPNYKSEYWMKYNVSGTPSLYLLGKDKTILAKKLNVENLAKYLERITY